MIQDRGKNHRQLYPNIIPETPAVDSMEPSPAAALSDKVHPSVKAQDLTSHTAKFTPHFFSSTCPQSCTLDQHPHLTLKPFLSLPLPESVEHRSLVTFQSVKAKSDAVLSTPSKKNVMESKVVTVKCSLMTGVDSPATTHKPTSFPDLDSKMVSKLPNESNNTKHTESEASQSNCSGPDAAYVQQDAHNAVLELNTSQDLLSAGDGGSGNTNNPDNAVDKTAANQDIIGPQKEQSIHVKKRCATQDDEVKVHDATQCDGMKADDATQDDEVKVHDATQCDGMKADDATQDDEVKVHDATQCDEMRVDDATQDEMKADDAAEYDEKKADNASQYML